MRRPIQTWLLLLPFLANGCVTHRLWTESDLDEWNEPAVNPNLHLFRAENEDDFLVVYDEYSDRYYTTHTRAFFLEANQKPLTQHQPPIFVNTNAASGRLPVRVYCLMPTNAPDWFYGVAATNSGQFTIYSGTRKLGAYSLPYYDDGVGRMERILWTPLTVTADITIIGGVVAIICWDALAQTDSSVSVH